MENLKNADLQNPAPAAGNPEGKPENQNPENPQSPLQKELEKVNQRREGHSKREKLIYSKNRIDQQLRELDEQEGLEPELPEGNDEDKPVTLGMLKKIEAEKAQRTAIQLADEITDASERELVKHHLVNSVKPTGNPNEDLRLARAIVNSAKNAQIAEELARRGTPSSIPSGSGAPANHEVPFEPNAEEAAFMKAPFNMTKEDILKARKLSELKKQ